MGVKIHYEVKGRGQPVLFIHGYGGSTITWKRQVPFFSKNYKVISIDLRGHGKSDKPRNYVYTLDKIVEDVHKLIKKLDVKPVVVGVSLGGIISLMLAAKHPRSVKAIVVVSSVMKSTQRIMNDFMKRALTDFEVNMLKKLLGKKIKINPNKTLTDISWRDRKLLSKIVFNTAIEAKIQLVLEVLNTDLTKSVKKISVPALIVYGEDDWVPKSQAELMHKLIKDSRLVVLKNAGHMLPFQSFKRFNKLLDGFLTLNYST
ncbi:MAG: alpha/beta hydrolase [Nanoarchaeota archaeon]|nr:alpha/beta hydrolase [Nanoarchaeota archaeon]